jgi:hypothetical protein
MQVQPWFKDWFNSPYYHQLYFNRDEAEAAAFIDKLIDHLHPQIIPAFWMLPAEREDIRSPGTKRI